MDAEVHEQMSRFGGLSEQRPSVIKTRSKLGTHLSTQCSGDERQSRPCADPRIDRKNCEPSHKWSAFTSRGEQLGYVSTTRERSVDICSWLLPLDEKLYLAPSASVKNDLTKNLNNQIADDFYKSCTTSSEDRQIVSIAVTDRSVTSRSVEQHIDSGMHLSVSARTIRRRLQQSGLSARHPLIGLPLTQNH
ncbi:transposable element Tcb1 transposase [Trichonephila clavipes]|nr:transposable element Tcb1 transposase [Trichonephila clavipes]